MPHSYSRILVHIVFSTRGRIPILRNSFREQLHAYIIAVVENIGGSIIAINSVRDHIHMLVAPPKNLIVGDLIKKIKVSSTKWINSESLVDGRFAWQGGYGCFSVSARNFENVVRYIEHQEQHHKRLTFEEEYKHLLQQLGVADIPKYL